MGSNFLTGFNKDRQQVLFIKYPCSDNTYCPAVELNLDPGKYLFELWGARGYCNCGSDNIYGCKGAYVKGFFYQF